MVTPKQMAFDLDAKRHSQLQLQDTPTNNGDQTRCGMIWNMPRKADMWSRMTLNPVGTALVALMLLATIAWIGSVNFFDVPTSSSQELLEVQLNGEFRVVDGRNFMVFVSTRDILGFSLATIGLLIAAGGGIGGGGFLVPIYILILGLSPKEAIPLSNVTVVGGALANTLINLPKRHPLVDRPLIDWDIILLMEPLTVAGALIGASLNKILPDRIIVILLVILLFVTTYKTLQKAGQLFQKENEEREQQTPNTWERTVGDESDTDESTQIESEGQSTLCYTSKPSHPLEKQGNEYGQPTQVQRTAPGTPTSRDCLLGKELNCSSRYNYGTSPMRHSSENLELIEKGDTDEKDNDQYLYLEILEQEKSAPTWNVLVVVWMFLFVLAVNLLKGGGSFPSILGIQCGSVSYWLAQASVLACTVIVTWIGRNYVLKRAMLKEQANYTYLPCDIQWNDRNTILYPCFSAVAGLVAGMFGVGGGLVKGPLLLAMGVHPVVTCATTACMILFTSFTATSAFAVFGLLIPGYAVVCAVVGFVTTVAGQTIMSYLLGKYQRNSFIAFCIGGVVAISAICMTIESVVKIHEEEEGNVSCGLCACK